MPQPRIYNWEKRFGGEAHRFPDFIQNWNRRTFFKAGALMSALSGAGFYVLGPWAIEAWIAAAPVLGYWIVGLNDLKQTQHTVRRNFPVLGNIRYIFETIRPEIRQYFIESDTDAVPFSREARSIAYARAKTMTDALPFGTRRNVYQSGYEWINHSIWPKEVAQENSRVWIGGKDCTQKYSACLLNVSGMSFGALSKNAVLALNAAAKMGNFYQNTGEGSISKFHLENEGDIVWNIGTGYFGCRDANGHFSDSKFEQTAALPQVKMIEIKLSQGAKPGHGGMLPKSKLTPEIAEARGVPMDQDCISPANHSAFKNPAEFVDFIAHLRNLSGGKPVGFKFCVGRPEEFAAIVQAMLAKNVYPDFITVDGGEGGTGAAPQEFSNHIGMPLGEGLPFVDQLLTAAAIRDQIKIIASGKVLSGFTVVRTLALGADLCNSARAMMFALGCIQALKCNTNHCPTGIATQDPELMRGLVVEDKATRVFNYHRKTVESALDLIGAVGLDNPAMLRPEHIMKRVSSTKVSSYAELFPPVDPGCVFVQKAPVHLQNAWDKGREINSF